MANDLNLNKIKKIISNTKLNKTPIKKREENKNSFKSQKLLHKDNKYDVEKAPAPIKQEVSEFRFD